MRKDLFSKFENSPFFKSGDYQEIEDGGYYFERPWLGFIITVVVIVIIAVQILT